MRAAYPGKSKKNCFTVAESILTTSKAVDEIYSD